jgi:hypothetical protein
MNQRQRRNRRKAHDENSINEIRNLEAAEEVNRSSDVKHMLESAECRRFLISYIISLHSASMEMDELVANNWLAFDAGRRSVLQEISDDLRHHSPEGWAELNTEAIEKIKEF